MKYKYNLTREEVSVLVRALTFSLDFSFDYYVFAPKDGDYSDSANPELDAKLEKKAKELVDKLTAPMVKQVFKSLREKHEKV